MSLVTLLTHGEFFMPTAGLANVFAWYKCKS